MTKYLIFTWLLLCSTSVVQAQKYRLSDSEVSFYSDAPLEDIEAYNAEAKSIFDAETGEIAFVVPIKKFEFKKALMQEHFNENYLESDQYPNAKFEGKLKNFNTDKTVQEVVASGKLSIHGVTQQVEVPGTVRQHPSGFEMKATFPVKVADYNIKIPKMVFYNIAEEVEVRVNFQYQPYDP